MKPLPFLLAVFLPFGAHSADKGSLPSEVQSFVADRETCDHFAGEIDGYSGKDPELLARQAFVNESIEIYCAGTDRRLAALRSRYKANKKVIAKLSKYESKTEGCACAP